MKRFLAFLLAFSIFVSLFSAFAFASNWEMYVRSKEFSGLKVVNSKFYVPFKAFLDSLKYGYKNENGTIVITRDSSTRENFSITGNSVNCSFNDRTFVVPVVKIDGSSYANLDVLASYLNLAVTKTVETRIIDVMDKVAVAKHQENIVRINAYEKAMGKTGAVSESSKTGGSAEYDREKPVVQVGEIEGFLDQVSTWEARWRVKAKNTADEPVHNVMLVLHIQDGNGKDVDQLVKSIGTMNPGSETPSVEYYWQSPNRIVVFPKLEIKHTPLPKKEIKEGIETIPGQTKPAEQTTTTGN